MSLNDDVQLSKAEKAWKPSVKKVTRGRVDEPEEEDPEQAKTRELFKRLRSILNKLTPQKFQELMKQVTELTIDTEERLKGAIDLIFEKAISEPNFSVAYANMCRCLMGVSLVKVGCCALITCSSDDFFSATCLGHWTFCDGIEELKEHTLSYIFVKCSWIGKRALKPPGDIECCLPPAESPHFRQARSFCELPQTAAQPLPERVWEGPGWWWDLWEKAKGIGGCQRRKNCQNHRSDLE